MAQSLRKAASSLRSPSGEALAAGHFRDFSGEIALHALVDALAALEANEARDHHRSARRLRRRLTQLLDRLTGHDHGLLLEERDLRVPLVQLPLDDLGPRRLRLRLRILAHLTR